MSLSRVSTVFRKILFMTACRMKVSVDHKLWSLFLLQSSTFRETRLFCLRERLLVAVRCGARRPVPLLKTPLLLVSYNSASTQLLGLVRTLRLRQAHSRTYTGTHSCPGGVLQIKIHLCRHIEGNRNANAAMRCLRGC